MNWGFNTYWKVAFVAMQPKCESPPSLLRQKVKRKSGRKPYDRELSDVLALQAEIAQQVANEIDQTLGGQKQVPTNSLNSSPQAYEAYELYLRGQYFFNKRSNEGFEQAIHYFQQAIRKGS